MSEQETKELIYVDPVTFDTSVSAYAMEIKVFKDIVKRDRGTQGDKTGRFKKRAKCELAYIYFSNNIRSPYMRSVPDEKERNQKIISDLSLPEDWKPDAKVKAAIDKYLELNEDHVSRMYKKALRAYSKLESYLEQVDFSARDDNGRPIYSVKEFRDTLKELNTVTKSLDELENTVKKREEEGGNESYGGVEVTAFNE